MNKKVDNNGKRKIGLSRKGTSRILLVAGGLLLVAALCYELATYPWSTVNDENVNALVLPDPTLPPGDYAEFDPSMLPGADDRSSGTLEIPDFGNDETATPDNGSGYVAPNGDNAVTALFTGGTGRDIELLSSTSKTMHLGIIKIPRINLADNIFTGANNDAFHIGVGHVTGSAFPNQEGNVVIAGHRDSPYHAPFKHLDKMQIGDIITIKYWGNLYSYEVFDLFIVPKDETWVMDDQEDYPQMLTVITCDPLFYLLGNRPDRLIVWAQLIQVEENVD